jgi:small subunit ribosomal protein S9
MAKQHLIQTNGRRKTSTARATLTKGTGKMYVNNIEYTKYFSNELSQLKVLEPLAIADLMGKYDFTITVTGGGFNSQSDAVRQCVARALVEVTGSDELKKTFLEYDRSMLVSDTRFKEMKKPNDSAARASRQKSYR